MSAIDGELSATAPLPAVRAGGRPWSRDDMTAWLLVAPAVLSIIALFIVPIGYVLLLSVTDPTVSLDHYRRLFTVPLYTSVMVEYVQDLADRHRRLPAARLSPRLCDGAPRRLAGGRLPRRRGHEFLDRLRRAHLCLAGDPRQQGAGFRPLWLGRLGKAAAAPVHVVQLDAGHDPYPAALHGARALRRDAQDRSLLHARRRGSRRPTVHAHSATSSCRSACPAW